MQTGGKTKSGQAWLPAHLVSACSDRVVCVNSWSSIDSHHRWRKKKIMLKRSNGRLDDLHLKISVSHFFVVTSYYSSFIWFAQFCFLKKEEKCHTSLDSPTWGATGSLNLAQVFAWRKNLILWIVLICLHVCRFGAEDLRGGRISLFTCWNNHVRPIFRERETLSDNRDRLSENPQLPRHTPLLRHRVPERIHVTVFQSKASHRHLDWEWQYWHFSSSTLRNRRG